MDYQLIQKVNRCIRVLKTPAGVQIWMKGKRIEGANDTCIYCGRKIGKRPAFVPMAGETLPNGKEQIHTSCVAKLPLLPMETNPYIIEEETGTNGTKHQ